MPNLSEVLQRKKQEETKPASNTLMSNLKLAGKAVKTVLTGGSPVTPEKYNYGKPIRVKK